MENKNKETKDEKINHRDAEAQRRIPDS